MFDQVHDFLRTHPDFESVFKDSRLSVRQFDARGGFAHVYSLKLPFWPTSRKKLEVRIQAAVEEQFQGAFPVELAGRGKESVLRISYHPGKAQEMADTLERRRVVLSGIIKRMARYRGP